MKSLVGLAVVSKQSMAGCSMTSLDRAIAKLQVAETHKPVEPGSRHRITVLPRETMSVLTNRAKMIRAQCFDPRRPAIAADEHARHCDDLSRLHVLVVTTGTIVTSCELAIVRAMTALWLDTILPDVRTASAETC